MEDERFKSFNRLCSNTLFYKRLNRNTKFGHFLVKLINFFARSDWSIGEGDPVDKIKIAIIGAGGVGIGLAEELNNNSNSTYVPVCFVDIDKEKLGRQIFGKDVLSDTDETPELLKEAGANKIAVIKVVRDVTGLGLKEAKELVDGAPKTVKEGAAKEEAEEIKAKFTDAGAVVELQ